MSSYSVQPKLATERQSRWIGSIVSKAIVLWLRSQVESVEQLEVEINAGNRTLLKGEIPQVTLKAAHGVYQGLYLSHIYLVASKIQANLRQMIQGKPLQLLQPIAVRCQLGLSQTDLNHSLSAPLFRQALGDTLLPWLQSQDSLQGIQNLQTQKITLMEHYIILEGTLTTSHKTLSFQLQTQLEPLTPQTLRLTHPLLNILPAESSTPLEDLSLDLGSDVEISNLILASEQLTLQGQIQVNP